MSIDRSQWLALILTGVGQLSAISFLWPEFLDLIAEVPDNTIEYIALVGFGVLIISSILPIVLFFNGAVESRLLRFILIILTLLYGIAGVLYTLFASYILLIVVLVLSYMMVKAVMKSPSFNRKAIWIYGVGSLVITLVMVLSFNV